MFSLKLRRKWLKLDCFFFRSYPQLLLFTCIAVCGLNGRHEFQIIKTQYGNNECNLSTQAWFLNHFFSFFFFIFSAFRNNEYRNLFIWLHCVSVCVCVCRLRCIGTIIIMMSKGKSITESNFTEKRRKKNNNYREIPDV